MSTKSQIGTQGSLYIHTPFCIGDVIQITIGIGCFVVHSGGHHPLLYRFHTNDGFQSPAAPRRCPVTDLVDETTRFPPEAWEPKAVLMAMVSNLSLYAVDVPCALM